MVIKYLIMVIKYLIMILEYFLNNEIYIFKQDPTELGQIWISSAIQPDISVRSRHEYAELIPSKIQARHAAMSH